MATIKYGSGTLYILNSDRGYEPLGTVNDIEERTEDMYTDDTSYFTLSEPTSLKYTTRLSRDAIMVLFGLREAVLEHCQNKRVVHLARHAKRFRTRKKNFNRAIRTLEDLK